MLQADRQREVSDNRFRAGKVSGAPAGNKPPGSPNLTQKLALIHVRSRKRAKKGEGHRTDFRFLQTVDGLPRRCEATLNKGPFIRVIKAPYIPTAYITHKQMRTTQTRTAGGGPTRRIRGRPLASSLLPESDEPHIAHSEPWHGRTQARQGVQTAIVLRASQLKIRGLHLL